MIDKQRALGVVDLVLNAGGEQTIRFDLVPLAFEVLVFDLHRARPLDLFVIFGNRQAPFFVLRGFIRLPDDLRIDEHLRLVILLLLRQIHGDDPFGDGDLDRRQPDARRVVHGLEQVIDQLADAGVDTLDRLRLEPQPLVRKFDDLTHSHDRAM